jgi:N-acylneuraminate cytidylyltransferase
LIEGKTVLAVIPARGGSKGVPRKNVRLLGQKPLITWTIDAAKQSKYIDRLILSSDDEEIISVAETAGCEVPFVRPDDLASDQASGVDVLLHAVEAMGGHYDYLILLQPTSPFRLTEDIDGAIKKCVLGAALSCVSVCETAKHPAWMYTVGESDSIVPFLPADADASRRQDLTTVYVLNGAVYVVAVGRFMVSGKLIVPGETIAYRMPAERSQDIDSEFDFSVCELLAEKLR